MAMMASPWATTAGVEPHHHMHMQLWPQMTGPQWEAHVGAVGPHVLNGGQMLTSPAVPPHMQMQLISQPGAAGAFVDWQSCATAPAQDSADPVSAFMEQLGIHPSEDYLCWIAELGLQSPLPPQWEACVDLETGCTYYINQDEQTSSWDNPLLPYLQRVVEIGREYAHSNGELVGELFFGEARQVLWSERLAELKQWHGPFEDAAGAIYFVNSSSGKASPRDPWGDAQYVFDLQSSFLSSLEEVLAPPEEEEEPMTPGSHWARANAADEEEKRCLGAQPSCVSPPAPSAAEKVSRRLAELRQHAKVDHRGALQSMTCAIAWLHAISLEEEEVQKLLLSRHVDARKKRARRAALRRPSGSSEALGDLTMVKLQDGLPAQLDIDAANAPEDDGDEMRGPSPSMAGRFAPRPLQFEDDDVDSSAMVPKACFSRSGGPLTSPSAPVRVPPPCGVPSPANSVRPPQPLLNAQSPELPPPPLLASPSLHRRLPGKEWAAEAFVNAAMLARGGAEQLDTPTNGGASLHQSLRLMPSLQEAGQLEELE